MKLTKDQKARVAKIIQGAVANANHGMVHAKTDNEREFYRSLHTEAQELLPLFMKKEAVEVEEEEEDAEEGEQ
jgi:DNA replication initiation complex subunit (GINS family)